MTIPDKVDDSEESMNLVRLSRFYIDKIDNPSERIQLAAVRESGTVIRYIKNPTPKVILEAVLNNALAIQFVKDPPQHVQIVAVTDMPGIISMIHNPTNKVMEIATDFDPKLIVYNPDCCMRIKKKVVKRDGMTIRYMKERDEELERLALENNPRAIHYIHDHDR